MPSVDPTPCCRFLQLGMRIRALFFFLPVGGCSSTIRAFRPPLRQGRTQQMPFGASERQGPFWLAARARWAQQLRELFPSDLVIDHRQNPMSLNPRELT